MYFSQWKIEMFYYKRSTSGADGRNETELEIGLGFTSVDLRTDTLHTAVNFYFWLKMDYKCTKPNYFP